MKPVLLTLMTTLILFSCKKVDSSNSSPTDMLPPYTDTGANTFGCTVDGKAFKPQAAFGSTAIILQSTYQFVAGRNQFSLRGSDYTNKNSVYVIMDSATLKQDSTYTLKAFKQNNYGQYLNSDYVLYYTKPPSYQGEFQVKHFDPAQSIVSGTFWFDVVDTTTGKVVQVRDGRFDVHFTR